ncbi:MAG: aminopeptidase P N-terminal domain-containing protein, partial [Ignavibacteria bacterium]
MNKIAHILKIIAFFAFISTNVNLRAQVYAYTDMSVFAERRAMLMEQIVDGIAVFVSSPVYMRNGDVSHNHRQHSDFYYLTGFEEPRSAFILDPNGKNKFIMFVQPKNPAIEIWTGKRTGVEGALTLYNADNAYFISSLDSILNIYIENAYKIYYAKSYDKDFIDKLQNKLSSFKEEKVLADPSEIIHEMRLFKSGDEINLLKKAIDITCNAIIEVMKSAKPGMYEYELQAVLEYNFMKNGSQRIGFPSV